jgi:hypothetical protein
MGHIVLIFLSFDYVSWYKDDVPNKSRRQNIKSLGKQLYPDNILRAMQIMRFFTNINFVNDIWS